MQFTPVITDHPLYQSALYLNLLDRLNDDQITSYVSKSPLAQLMLSIIENSRVLSSDIHYKKLQDELLAYIKDNHKFENRFIVGEEICRFFKDQNVFANSGRGSMASSLICYGLGITKIDPVQYKLDWRRYHSKETMFDLDLPNRQLVINYLENKYPGKIAYLGIDVKHKLKATFRTVMEPVLSAKQIFDYVRLIDKCLEKSSYNGLSTLLSLITNNSEFASIKNSDLFIDLLEKIKIKEKEVITLDSENNKKTFLEITSLNFEFKQLFQSFPEQHKTIYSLLDEHKEYGIHAGALIFADSFDSLDLIPGLGKKVVNPKHLLEIEAAGLKYNLLETTFFTDINLWIKENRIEVDKMNVNQYSWKLFNIDNYALDEVFQCKMISSYMAKMDLNQISGIEAFAEYTSHFRPGPLSVYSNDEYKNGNFNCPPRFISILKDTRGWLVYQEDLLNIADILKISEPMEFLKKAAKKQYDKMDKYKDLMTAEEFDFVMKYSSSTFNKSHAISYAYISLLDAIAKDELKTQKDY